MAVTGGTGFLGSHIVDALVDQGHDPVCLVRPTSDRKHLDTLGITQIPGSLTENERLKRLVADADAVVHTAGVVAASHKEGYHEANALGTKNLLAAMDHASPDHLLYVSSLAAKGPSPTLTPLSADSPPGPVSDYGRSKLAAEHAVKAWAQTHHVTCTIVRPPALYGPRDRGLLGLLKAAKHGFYPLVIPKDSALSLLYGEDCARLIAAALTARPTGETRLIEPADGPPHTPDTVRESVSEALGGRRLRPLPVPGPLLVGLAGLTGLAGRLTGKANMLNPDKVRELRAKHWIADLDTLKRLDWRPATTLTNGLRTTHAWYEQEGWL